MSKITMTIWHRMRYSCTHYMATVGVRRVDYAQVSLHWTQVNTIINTRHGTTGCNKDQRL